MNQDEKNLRLLEIIAETRKFEIQLFWSRSLFFWGFTTLVITAYGAAYHYHVSRDIQFAVACGGFICSWIWMLVNRSSKYWQKVWEVKAAEASLEAAGRNLFAEPQRPHLRMRDFPWWSAHFSVSKLATAFSDFTGLVWGALVFRASPLASLLPHGFVIPIVAVITAIYAGYVWRRCGPDPWKNSN